MLDFFIFLEYILRPLKWLLRPLKRYKFSILSERHDPTSKYMQYTQGVCHILHIWYSFILLHFICCTPVKKLLDFITNSNVIEHKLWIWSGCSLVQSVKTLPPSCKLILNERSWSWMIRSHDEDRCIVFSPTGCVAQQSAHLSLAQSTDGFPNSASAKAIKWSAGAKWLHCCWGVAVGSVISACYCLRPLCSV